jgi:hypothetical protein
MTKATTRAQKRKAKRGRPRLPAAERERNGRHSRRAASTTARQTTSEENTMNVAVQRRIREYELVDRRIDGKQVTARQQALDPMRGYVLGCMCLDGVISRQQHDAGAKFAEDMSRYYGTAGLAFPSARAQNLFAVRGSAGEETDEHVIRAKAARHKAKSLQAVLMATGDIDTGRRVYHAVTQVCLMDIPESRRWPAHMTSYLVRGLNALVKHYGGNGA